MIMEHGFVRLFECRFGSLIPQFFTTRNCMLVFGIGLLLVFLLPLVTPDYVGAQEGEKTEGATENGKTEEAEKVETEEEEEDIERLGMQNFPNRLMLRAGWYYLFGSKTTVTSTTNLAGIGTTIDFEDTLGGDTTASNVRVDAKYRFTPRHSLGFTYYRVAQSGSAVANQDITIEDTIIKAGSQTTSGLSINLYRFMYNWSFYSNEKVELGVSPGLYFADFKFNVSGNLTVEVDDQQGMFEPSTVEEAFTAPLPSIGGYVNYYITPRLNTELRADVFYLQAGNFIGSMVEFYAGLEYRVFDNFALGAAYDRLNTRIDINDIDAATGWNLVYVYGSLYFFDI